MTHGRVALSGGYCVLLIHHNVSGFETGMFMLEHRFPAVSILQLAGLSVPTAFVNQIYAFVNRLFKKTGLMA